MRFGNMDESSGANQCWDEILYRDFTMMLAFRRPKWPVFFFFRRAD